MSKDELEALPEAVVARGRGLSLAWFVPLVALAAAGVLAYTQLVDTGPRVTIRFHDGTGLDRDQTVIRYQGVECGRVTGIRFSKDLKHVIVEAELTDSAEAIARAGSKFWIVRPEIGLGGVRGLETITTGPYIQVLPGDGDKQTTFDGLDDAPPLAPQRPGIRVTLRARTLGSLKVGSSVFYREVPIGQIDTYEIDDDGASVRIVAHIESQYARLVRANTRFWNVSGVDLRVGLLGTDVRAGSLETILAGGLAMATPSEAGGPVPKDKVFEVFDDAPEAWIEWVPLPEPADASAANAPDEDGSELGEQRAESSQGSTGPPAVARPWERSR